MVRLVGSRELGRVDGLDGVGGGDEGDQRLGGTLLMGWEGSVDLGGAEDGLLGGIRVWEGMYW